MFYDLKDKKPKSSGENWVAPNATIIGDVTLEKNTSIWFNAVLRGDIENIFIGEGSNVQDGSVLHTDPGCPLKVGKDVTIGHMVMLHGCTIGDNSLIGIPADYSGVPMSVTIEIIKRKNLSFLKMTWQETNPKF